MNMWTIMAVFAALLVVAGVTLASAGVLSNDSPETETELPSCGQSCGNSCSSTSNCDQASCGAKVGKSCGCS